MSRWFRHYAGMMRDDKLVRVAIRSKQPIERVVWIWGAILESASEIDDAGKYDLDAAEVSYFLRADEADVVGVLRELEVAGRTAEGCVVKWSNRQFQSDRSAERVARHRAKKREDNVSYAQCNEDVTLQVADGNAPDTELDTEKEVKPRKRAARTHDFQVPDWVPAKPWQAYANMRGKKRAPIDSYIAEKQFAKLAEIRDAGWDMAKVLDKATVNFWTDLYMPTPGKDDNLRAGKPPPSKIYTPEQSAEYRRIMASDEDAATRAMKALQIGKATPQFQPQGR